MGKTLIFLIAGIFTLTLAGCATAPKQNSQVDGLKNQITTLEDQLKSRDEEIVNLKDELAKAVPVSESVAAELSVKASPKAIQTALQNSGYYNGPIDGRLGKQTREAIRAFQKANNLKADGRVGQKTWSILKNYVEKKVK
jgi:peptidoglycan hydrolase-like protein with peptidoglycan-binding domain